MKKFTLPVFAVGCVLGLAACSGGGSGDHTSPPPASKAPDISAVPPGNSAAPASRIGGHALTTHKLDASDVKRHVINNGNMDEITIEGKKIYLNLPGTELNGFVHTPHSAAETTSIGKQFKHLRFGSYINWTTWPQGVVPAYSFAVGHITPDADVPAGGRASYKGNALVSPTGHKTGDSGGFFQSYAAFDVDFGGKTINGRLDYNGNDAHNIHLSGTIHGASFSGERDGVSMQGNFYGPQAAELGGTFSGPITINGVANHASGSFGAARQ